MKTPTGAALVEAITQIVDRENRKGQNLKLIKARNVLETFTREHGLGEKLVPTLSRLLRKLEEDPDAIRQIRIMSDSLLNMDERELKSDLVALKEQLMPVEARIHQVKTKTAFVSTMLRPFSPKYTSIWFAERTDIDVKQAQKIIEQLEIMKIQGMDDLAQWARGVAEVFEHVVVYQGPDAADPYARPTGTVSEKSSKPYLQAWSAFIDTFQQDMWRLAGGSEPDYEFRSAPIVSRRSESFSYDFEHEDALGLDQDVPKLKRENVSMMMSAPRDYPTRNGAKSAPRSKTPKLQKGSPISIPQASEWIQIFIESKLDPSAQATRKWESQADFRQSLQKWLDTLPVIWGPAADQFLAKVSVKTATGESDLTLPALTVKDAADRLTKAVEMQQD